MIGVLAIDHVQVTVTREQLPAAPVVQRLGEAGR